MSGNLRVFRDPESVAVVGASANPEKWGYWLARGALRGRNQRQVHLINSQKATIEGVKSVASLNDLNVAPDLVVLCTPPANIPKVVDEALALGARGFIGITDGISHAHGDPALESQISKRIRDAGARLIGPSSLGVYDATHNLDLVWGNFEPGHLAIITQSGQIGLELAGLAAHAGIGVSRFVSVGKQVDVTATEILADLCNDEHTRVVVLYLENFPDGRQLVNTLYQLQDNGKHVVLLTVGASEAGRQAAHSHTGALTAEIDLVDAACRASGAVLVQTPAEAIDLATLFSSSPLPHGRRLGIVSDSGGQGAIAADALSRAGLIVPILSESASAEVAKHLPVGAGTRNPIDLAGAGERSLTTYHQVVESLLASNEVDSVLLSGYFGSYGLNTPSLLENELEVVETLAQTVSRYRRPLLVHSMSDSSSAVQTMRERALPTFPTIDRAAKAAGYAAIKGQWQPPTMSLSAQKPSKKRTAKEAFDYLTSRDLFRSYGVEYPMAFPVSTAEEVIDAANQLSAPFVLKAGWLEHKTEMGGIQNGILDAGEGVKAFKRMQKRLGSGSYVLEESDTREHTVELIVGAYFDSSFGPIVMVGTGGLQAELYRDVCIALAPVSEEEAIEMLQSLHSYPLLEGWRGLPPVNIIAAAQALSSVSQLIVAEPVSECEINPLRVGPDRAVAVDALVIGATPEN